MDISGPTQTCFNSSMVRLKDLYTASNRHEKDQFQFQYGAIKGVILRVALEEANSVSIPVWCD